MTHVVQAGSSFSRPVIAVASVVLLAACMSEERAWNSARETHTVEGYEAFLERYDDGEHRVVAEENSFFQLPEVGLGLVPGAGGTVSLPRRIGRQKTAWLGLSGQRIDAQTALAWGLVDEVRLGRHA